MKTPLLAAIFCVACGSSSTSNAPDATGADAADETLDAISESDVIDAAPFPVRRLPCLPRSALATDLPGDQYGALEGEVVAVVPPGSSTCPSDGDHLHLQVEASGKRYDVAITIAAVDGTPIGILEKDIAPALPDPGWSGAGFDYPKDLGVASADYTPLAKSMLLSRLQGQLATASRVGIHGRAYADGTGLHNVHRNGGTRDGVILMRRNGAGGTDHAVALRFSGDVF